MSRRDVWNELKTRTCPWCGRTLYGWSVTFECGGCGVRWTKEGMETRGPDDEETDRLGSRIGWKPAPDGCLVVRRPA